MRDRYTFNTADEKEITIVEVYYDRILCEMGGCYFLVESEVAIRLRLSEMLKYNGTIDELDDDDKMDLFFEIDNKKKNNDIKILLNRKKK